MALLSDNRILITGVLTDDSLAFGIARARARRRRDHRAVGIRSRHCRSPDAPRKKLGDVGEIIELDVMDPEQVERAPSRK